MSSARCLNWSRPPPGRHPALRKQVSYSEPSPSSSSLSSSSSSSFSTPVGPSPPANHPVSSVRHGRTASLPGPEDFCHQFLVTGAIIHTNRFQHYHTYDQARRGGSASLVRPRIVAGAGRGDPGGRERPASASVGQRTPVSAGPERRGVLCRQLSLDQSILVQSSFTSGMAAVASGGGLVPVGGEQTSVEAALLSGDGERGAWNGFNRKQQRVGAGTKNDNDLGGGKKGLKAGGGKDSRINIKIFLGQTVQQDSSDTGVSDTEGTGPQGTMHAPGGPTGLPTTVLPTESTASCTAASKAKPTGVNGASGPVTNTPNNAPSGATHPGTGSTPVAATGNANAPSAGRNSSLTQRRAQFQANRQNSEAYDRRHPPLVRALSAPTRPADPPDTSKFLQGKKKPRRRKVLREKDEFNICEEDEFSDDGDSKHSLGGGGATTFIGAAAAAAAAAAAGKPFPSGLPMRSRSVLGGACDIETLVSLLSSGGSDSEKEQEPAQASPPSPTVGAPLGTFSRQQHQFSSAHLPAKGRAPMLKKAGKSVSFQETDLKPSVGTAGLNRDYRKPSFQPTVASRLRRTQQLVSTLNAFQLKDKDKDKSSARDGDEETGDRPTSASGKDVQSQPASVASNGVGKAESNKATANVGATVANGDLQTPKEQECYRLFLKMSKKGLAVSYDTILRGMLTPTELRVLQKKKSREQRLNSGTDGAENGLPGAEKLSPENVGGFEGGIKMEELRGLQETTVDSPASQTQDVEKLHQPPEVAASAQGERKESETESEENIS